MKIYLDDERKTPDGWIRVYWPSEAIDYLKTGKVTVISLDHDLGDDDRGTGYDVVLWLEEAVATTQFIPPKILVHSANSSARNKMELGIKSIQHELKNSNKAFKTRTYLSLASCFRSVVLFEFVLNLTSV